LRPWVGDIPGSPDACDARSPDFIDAHEARVVDRETKLLHEAVQSRPDVGADEDSGSLNGSTVAEHHTPQAIVLHDEPSNLRIDYADASCLQLLAFGRRQVVGVREEDQVV
jgi:hypothetical protein